MTFRKYLYAAMVVALLAGTLFKILVLDDRPAVHSLPPMSISTVSTVLTGEYPDHVRELADRVLHNLRPPQELRGAIDLWDSLRAGRGVEIEAPTSPEMQMAGIKPGEIIKTKIPELDAETALDLAICIRGEADKSEADRAPIAFTLLRRMTLYNIAAKKLNRKPRTYRDQIRAFCQIFNRDAALYNDPRRVDIRSSSFDDPVHGTPEEWAALEDFVYSWEAGAIKDPCPLARIWGGRDGVDPIREGCIQIPCGGASNRFQRCGL